MKKTLGLGAFALVLFFLGCGSGCSRKPVEGTSDAAPAAPTAASGTTAAQQASPATPEAAKANEEALRREKRGY